MGSVSAYFVGLKGAIVMSVIAFSIVAIIIAGLMLLMMLLHKICSKIENDSKKEKIVEQKVVVPNISTVQNESDEDLIALITAAIYSFSNVKPKILNFKPIKVSEPRRTAWASMNIMNNSERN